MSDKINDNQAAMPLSNSTHRRSKKVCAIDCTWPVNSNRNDEVGKCSLTAVQALVNNSLSPATKRAYKSDMDDYSASGGTIPSSPMMIAEYIASLVSTHKPATINRRLASLSKAHGALGVDDPVKTEIVRSTMRGIRRLLPTAPQQASPLLREDLFAVLDIIGDHIKDDRDKALLLLGFAGAFRRTELVGLNVDDIERVSQGIIVNLRRSKTDQTGMGRKIGIPYGRTKWCPVKHLDHWLEIGKIEDGPLFRSMDHFKQVSDNRLSGEAVSLIIKDRVRAAGFDPVHYSGHSLRSGLATSAVIAGASTFKIREITGHTSDVMLQRYVRDGNLFEDNAIGYVL